MLTSHGFLIGEAGQPTQMAPVGAGNFAAIGASQLSVDLGRYGSLQSSRQRYDSENCNMLPKTFLAKPEVSTLR